MPPRTNHLSPIAGDPITLGTRKPATQSCRDEVVAALRALADRTGMDGFSAHEIYTEMVTRQTRFARATVIRTLRRMTEAPGRLPWFRLERVNPGAYRIAVN